MPRRVHCRAGPACVSCSFGQPAGTGSAGDCWLSLFEGRGGCFDQSGPGFGRPTPESVFGGADHALQVGCDLGSFPGVQERADRVVECFELSPEVGADGSQPRDQRFRGLRSVGLTYFAGGPAGERDGFDRGASIETGPLRPARKQALIARTLPAPRLTIRRGCRQQVKQWGARAGLLLGPAVPRLYAPRMATIRAKARVDVALEIPSDEVAEKMPRLLSLLPADAESQLVSSDGAARLRITLVGNFADVRTSVDAIAALMGVD